jgi:hypothetical protein
MNVEPYRISSPGDLEVAILYEAHDLMASTTTPFLYTVSGQPGNQQAIFKSAEAFQLFAIRVSEQWSEARSNVVVDGAPSNLSILDGLHWVIPRLREKSAAELAARLTDLSSWLDTVDLCRFWCGELQDHFEFRVARRHLWNVWANTLKHTFLRLQKVTGQINVWCKAAGKPVKDSDILYVLDAFEQWLSGYCEYHATMVAELVARVFLALNEVVIERSDANGGSNDARVISHPAGASTFFQDLHTSLLVFHRYPEGRISSYIPSTSPNLRRPYLP